jgi:hypothetical protein
MRTDWIPTGIVVGAALLCAVWALRDLSQRLASDWRAFQRRPIWFRALATALAVGVGVRLLRTGVRPLLVVVVVVGGLALWAARSARTRRP